MRSVGEKAHEGERSLSKRSISPRTSSSHQSLCLTFLFPRCTSIYNLILNHPSTVFGGALNQTALLPFFWRCFKVNLIQPSETSLNHSSLQRASTQWRNYWRAACKRRPPLVCCPWQRQKPVSVQKHQCLRKHLVHSTMETVTAESSHYLSYDIWDGGTSHQETVLVFQKNSSMGPCLEKKKGRTEFGKWYDICYSFRFQNAVFGMLYYTQKIVASGVNLGKC